MKNFYEDFANYAANLIGFNSTDIETGDKILKNLMDNSYFGGEPLKNYLCYRYFEPKTENFLMTNGAAGFLLEICPLVGIDKRITKSLNMFFANDLPQDGFLQFFLLASSDIDDFLSTWQNGRTNSHPVLKRISEARAEYLRKKAAEFRASGKKLPRCFRIFVSYSKICRRHNEEALGEIHQFRSKLMDKLSSLQLYPVVCASEELIRLCREIFEVTPGKSANYAPVNKLDTINDQSLQHGNHYIRQKRGFINKETGIAHRAYSFSKTPDFWSLMQNIELLGNAENNPIPARFAISLTVTNDFKTNKSLIGRGKRVIDSAERPYSRHDKALQEEAREWRDIIHSLEAKGEAALSESFCLFVSTKEDDIDRAESEIMTIFSNQSWQIKPLDYYHLEAMLGAMPMHGANFWYELKRHKLVQTSLSSEIVSKLPIHAEWWGVPLSGVPFIGRRGQIFNWNPYYRDKAGNFNINVIGPSGVGKSVFLQELASSMLSQDTRVFVLDIGKSYAALAQLLGGEIIEFGALSTYTINPFNGLKKDLSDTDFNQIVICALELLTIMCGAKGEFETATLESSIKQAVYENDFNLDIEKFVQFLSNSEDLVLKRFATSMFSYTEKGIYGKYFSGNKPANFDKAITIFEFENVKDQTKLISILQQSLLMQLTSQFLTGDRSKKFMVIVDEAWMLLDHSAAFFAACVRNFRRYGGSLVICTQCFADLQTAGSTQENNNHRKAIFENSAWKVNLPPTSVTDFEQHSEFKFKLPLLKSLSFQRGEYSEMLLSSAGIDVVGRLILDPYSAVIYSTEANDFSFLDAQEKAGVPIEQAIENLLDVKMRGRNG